MITSDEITLYTVKLDTVSADEMYQGERTAQVARQAKSETLSRVFAHLDGFWVSQSLFCSVFPGHYTGLNRSSFHPKNTFFFEKSADRRINHEMLDPNGVQETCGYVVVFFKEHILGKTKNCLPTLLLITLPSY